METSILRLGIFEREVFCGDMWGKMAPENYNAQFESQIASYKRARRMLVAHNVHFKVTRGQFESLV
ncbi:hypothetical protein ACHAQJ_001284 [Trichoderma viride]